MTTLRTYAEAYAQALKIGIVEVDEVITWVDSNIAQIDHPAYALIEASMSGNDRNNLIASLKKFPGDLDEDEARRRLFGYMFDA